MVVGKIITKLIQSMPSWEVTKYYGRVCIFQLKCLKYRMQTSEAWFNFKCKFMPGSLRDDAECEEHEPAQKADQQAVKCYELKPATCKTSQAKESKAPPCKLQTPAAKKQVQKQVQPCPQEQQAQPPKKQKHQSPRESSCKRQQEKETALKECKWQGCNRPPPKECRPEECKPLRPRSKKKTATSAGTCNASAPQRKQKKCR